MTRPTRRDFLERAVSSSLALSLGLAAHRPRAMAVPPETGGEPAGWPDNPFLQGNFAPVSEEIFVERLPVLGRLPGELRGMFVRNGPNPQFPPRGNYHWFDGDGMLHGVHLADGTASYRNRWIRTTGFQRERAAGRSLWGGLSDPPDLQKMLAGDEPFKNAANTALVWHDGRLLALWEAGPPHAVHLPDLETRGPYTYGGRLKHAFTAHPKVDPQTGEMVFFGYSAMSPVVHVSWVSPQGELVRTVPVRLPRPVMMHDFAITRRYAVLLDLPATFNMARLGRGEPLLAYERDLPARFGLLPREGSSQAVQWFEASTCFMFHTLNAWDEGDEVVLLGCRMQEYPEMLGTGPASGKSVLDIEPQSASKMHRWRFNTRTGAVQEEPLDERGCEFPRIHEGLLGSAVRYGYGMRLDNSGLVRYDLSGGGQLEHRYGPGRHGGEGVFVPRPGATAEDDGWLLNYVYDQAQGQSELVIVDGRDFAGPATARVLLPCRVPYGFHGTWVWQEQLEAQQASA